MSTKDGREGQDVNRHSVLNALTSKGQIQEFIGPFSDFSSVLQLISNLLGVVNDWELGLYVPEIKLALYKSRLEAKSYVSLFLTKELKNIPSMIKQGIRIHQSTAKLKVWTEESCRTQKQSLGRELAETMKTLQEKNTKNKDFKVENEEPVKNINQQIKVVEAEFGIQKEVIEVGYNAIMNTIWPFSFLKNGIVVSEIENPGYISESFSEKDYALSFKEIISSSHYVTDSEVDEKFYTEEIQEFKIITIKSKNK